jgi:hypothetical protein
LTSESKSARIKYNRHDAIPNSDLTLDTVLTHVSGQATMHANLTGDTPRATVDRATKGNHPTTSSEAQRLHAKWKIEKETAAHRGEALRCDDFCDHCFYCSFWI